MKYISVHLSKCISLILWVLTMVSSSGSILKQQNEDDYSYDTLAAFFNHKAIADSCPNMSELVSEWLLIISKFLSIKKIERNKKYLLIKNRKYTFWKTHTTLTSSGGSLQSKNMIIQSQFIQHTDIVRLQSNSRALQYISSIR